MKVIAIAALAALPLAAQQAPDRAFEVASVKAISPADGGRVNAEATRSLGGGCDGHAPEVDGHRFSVTTTAYALLTWAYGYNKTWGCSYVSFSDLLTGGPKWVQSDRFEIQAVMPDDAPVYTRTQFMAGDAPQLEAMIRSLLVERFKLAAHREARQVSGYALVRGKGELKLTRPSADDQPQMIMQRRVNAQGQVSNVFGGRKIEMRDIAFMLLLQLRRPVIDRTGLAGQFNFDTEFAPPDDPNPAGTADPSIFTAFQELGLKLENTKAPLDGVVIDHIELPTAN